MDTFFHCYPNLDHYLQLQKFYKLFCTQRRSLAPYAQLLQSFFVKVGHSVQIVQRKGKSIYEIGPRLGELCINVNPDKFLDFRIGMVKLDKLYSDLW